MPVTYRQLAQLPVVVTALIVALLSVAPSAAAQTYVSVHSFTSSESNDSQSTLTGTSPHTLLGTSPFGGTGAGTVFSISYDGSSPHAIHTFSGVDGANPQTGLLLNTVDNFFYGVTVNGGTGAGVVFKIDTSGNNFSVIHDLDGANEGSHPWGALAIVGSTLYGIASDFGASGYGVIFSIGTDGSNYTPIYGFGSGATDGTLPVGGLLVGDDGRLYGTTEHGHDGSGFGTIFVVNRDGTGFRTLHTFTGGADGQYPLTNLIECADGFLYGTTQYGGSAGAGTAFKLMKDGSSYSVFHEFAGDAVEGGTPSALIQVENGLLYGTTWSGGQNGDGTLFLMTTSGQLFTALHQFATASGSGPTGGVYLGLDGNLYGTTTTGGANNVGVLFRYTIPTIPVPPLPTSGSSAGGTSVTISGAGFESGAAVTFGGSQVAGPIITSTTITANTPALPAGTLNDIIVTNPDQTATMALKAWMADFLDVPGSDPFYAYVRDVFHAGITAGCGGGDYCRDSAVTRAQMAVLVLKGAHTHLFAYYGYASPFIPPACTGIFGDVECTPSSAFAVKWIEELYREGVTGGCSASPLDYCPGNPVTRAQMAVLLLKAQHGSSYTPPACTGVFEDVPCPSAFADWIEQLYNEHVTSGCSASPLYYCPDSTVTRGQMAVFLVKTFGLVP